MVTRALPPSKGSPSPGPEIDKALTRPGAVASLAAMTPLTETTLRVGDPDPTVTQCRGWLVLGLGSNLGDRQAQLGFALKALANRFGVLRVAPLYSTAPISAIAQDDYLNTVAIARLPPSEAPERSIRRVVGFAKALEARAGREANGQPSVRDSPRPLDVDLLLWGDTRMSLDAGSQGEREAWPGAIQVPHPRMHERRFVLAPLCDLVPRLCLPSGASVATLLARVSDQRVRRIPWSNSLFQGPALPRDMGDRGDSL